METYILQVNQNYYIKQNKSLSNGKCISMLFDRNGKEIVCSFNIYSFLEHLKNYVKISNKIKKELLEVGEE